MNSKIVKKSRFYPSLGSDWYALRNILYQNKEKPWEDVFEEGEEVKLLRKLGGVFVNDAFAPLWNVTNGLLFLDGGYGSSKTTYAITRLLVKCIENDHFRCYYGRQTKVDARKFHSNIVSEIKRNGWRADFDLSETPTGSLVITHKNGNKFIAFGCEDPDFLKGIDSETTDIIVDEINQISWESFGMLFTRLRGNAGSDLQMIGCFNNCDVYSDHWIRKFIYIKDGEAIKDFSESDETVLEALRNVNLVKHHSIYTDNYFQNNYKYYQGLVIKAGGDKVKIKAYCDGEWGVELSSYPYFKMFSEDRHKSWVDYDPNLPLHFSWDENLNPYLPVIIGQISGSEVRVIDEIAARNPYNSLEWVCEELVRKYYLELGHRAGLFIYGDSTSKKEDVKLEKGANFFTLCAKYLECFNPVLRNTTSNPNNKMRQAFVNAAFGLGVCGLKFKIHPKCTHLIEDFKQTKENPNKKIGGKDKRTETVDGNKGVQRYGHFGDAFEYWLCEAMAHAYYAYQNGNTSYRVSGGARSVRNSYEGEKINKSIFVSEEEQDSGYGIYKSKNIY